MKEHISEVQELGKMYVGALIFSDPSAYTFLKNFSKFLVNQTWNLNGKTINLHVNLKTFFSSRHNIF